MMKYSLLKDVRLSFFENGTKFDDETLGGQYVFLGTDTQPGRSPSLDWANSNMNLPSKTIQTK